MTKNAIISISVFLQFCTKARISVFCVFAFFVIIVVPITTKTCLAPQNDRLNLSFVKDEHIVGIKMARKVSRIGTLFQFRFE